MSIHTEFANHGYEALTSHSESVQTGTRIEEVYQSFQSGDHNFMALLDGETFVGGVSRSETMTLLSGRYGFPLFARRNVEDHLRGEMLSIDTEMPIRDVIEKSLTLRDKDVFYHDIALIDKKRRFLGMIPAHTLVKLQWELMNEDAEQIRDQREALEERNREILDNLNELRLSRGRWDSLFDRAPLGIAIVDSEGSIDVVNPSFEAIFGKTASSSKHILDLLATSSHGKFLETMKVASARRSPETAEFQLPPCVKGSALLVRTVFSCIPETGQMALLFEDITEQREMEKTLLDKEKSKVLDNLVGGIAHELNNKLSPLLGFLTLTGAKSEEGFDLNSVAPLMKEATQDAATIIRQLLDLSRPPALEKDQGDLVALLTSTVEFLKFEARENKCELVHLTSKECEQVIARFDSGQIRQVIINLILNAIDAVKGQETRRIEVSCKEDGEYAVVTVKDTGSGIPEHVQGRIFDAFFTTKQDGDGTGLGLSVCSNIARLHEGEITFESESDLGTSFQLRIPLCLKCLNGSPKVERQANRKQKHCDCSSARVLIAEDEPYVATFLQKALKAELGMESVTAKDGRDAIARLKKESFDLVISDVRMPEMDGFGLLQWIKENAPDLERRFVFVTGDAGGSLFEEKLQHLAPPVLRKPFVIDDLSATCHGLILAN